jgi:hypothetical protein
MYYNVLLTSRIPIFEQGEDSVHWPFRAFSWILIQEIITLPKSRYSEKRDQYNVQAILQPPKAPAFQKPPTVQIIQILC